MGSQEAPGGSGEAPGRLQEAPGESPGGGEWRHADFRPPKEGRFCGEGGICGEVSRVEVGRLRRKIRNAVRARRGGGSL